MRQIARTLAATLIAAAPAIAEVGPSPGPEGDLATIWARADELGEGRDLLDQLERFGRSEEGIRPERLREMLGDRTGADGPFRYRDSLLVMLAAERAQLLSVLLAADLDNDGNVTRDEIKRVLQIGRSHGMMGDLFLQFDTNLDDTVSAEELALGIKAATEGRQSRGQDRSILFGQLIDFDADGQITTEELDRAAAALSLKFAPIAGETRVTPAKKAAPAAGDSRPCGIPKPSDRALVQVVTGYEGDALANVSIGGQDRVTETAELVIEPGDKPIYLVVSSFELIIWRVVGAVDRVERIVVQSGVGSSDIRIGAVTGVPADRVTFVAAEACFKSGWESGRARNVADALRSNLGRDIDGVFADYTLASVALPSGKGKSVKKRRGEVDVVISGGKRYLLTEDGVTEVPTSEPGKEGDALKQEMDRFHPGGVVTFDPKAVVSAHPVEPYAVLPQEAGLRQLIDQGLIEPQGNGFRVMKPIPRFPAGLNGAHGVVFFLDSGVPMPAGDSGHSSVSDASGTCLTKICR